MKNNGKSEVLSPFASKINQVTMAMCLLILTSGHVSSAEFDFDPKDHGDGGVRVKTIVEVAGSLRLETLQKKTVEVPVEVEAELFFDEIGLSDSDRRAARHYWEAKAEFNIDDHIEQRQLRDDRRFIALGDVPNRFWSPQGMLRREELDLIDVAGSAFAPESLLPTGPVSDSASWPVEASATADLLRLDEVTKTDLKNRITEITEEVVKVDLVGQVAGVADGAETNIEVQGKYHYHRESRIISWFALALKETREIGPAAPGFEVTARIRSARQSIQQSDALPKRLQSAAQRVPTEGELLLEFASDGDLRYLAALDRRWRMVRQFKSSAKLRLVENGSLLLTCKADRLNRVPAGDQLTLNGFRDDVRQALAENCKEIASESETVNPQGVRVLRVVANGSVDKTPIRWIYYHLSDNQGQRLSLIFTHESSMESRLQSVDQAITASIELLPKIETAKLRQPQIHQNY